MATAETARLIASLELKDNMSKGLNSATAGIGKLEGKFNRIGGIAQKGVSSAITNITRLGLAGGVAIAGAVAFGIRSLADLGRTTEQTNAVIASTGGKAGVSAAQVRQYAEELEKVSTVDDKVIQDGANMLLTFTSIGGKVFPQATKAALNMAVAMAGGNVEAVDLKASAIQLGKALNDPIKGITALRKVGVAFTEAQIKQIKALVKSGDIIGAQTIILKELEVEFGNAAEAAGKGPEASWRRLQDVGEDLSQTIARGLLPVLTRAADWLSTKLADPAVVKVIDDIGQSLARAGTAALDFIETVDFKGIADSLGAAVGFAKGIVDVFMGMPDWVKQAVITGWGLNKLTGGAVLDLGKLVVEQFAARGATPANPLFVADVAGLGKGAAVGGTAKGALGLGSKVFLVGEAIGLALLVNEVRNGIAEGNTQFAKSLAEQNREWLAQMPDKGSLEAGLAAVEQGILRINADDPLNLVSGESLAELKAIRFAILDQLKNGTQPGNLALRGLGNKVSTVEAALNKMHQALHADLQAAIGVLKTSNDPAAIAAAVTAAVEGTRGGAGSAGTTKSLIGDLRAQLKAAEKSGNTDLAGKIKDAIKQIEPFAKGRQWQAEQIAEARKITESNRSTAEKVAALRTIQQDLLSHQRTMAGSIVTGLLAVVTAVKNIKLPAGQTVVVNPQTGFVTGGTPINRPTPKVNPQTGFVINTSANISTRDVTTAGNIRSRIGPTPTEVGAE